MSWRDWLYESDPVMDYPGLRGDLSVSQQNNVVWTPLGPVPVTPEGRLADAFSRDVDVSGGRTDKPEEVGRQRTGRKTKLGSALLDFLPSALQSGIAGAATQNVAGGGPVDFFRAMQAGGQSLDRRDANRMAMMQQQQQMAMQEDLRRSQQEENLAQADLYRAQTAAAQKPKPGFLDKYRDLVQSGMPEEQARVVASGGALQHMKPVDPNAGKVRVTPEVGGRLGVVPNDQGEFWAPSGAVREPSPARTPAPGATRYIPDEKGHVTAVTPDGKGGFTQVPLGGIGAPRREPRLPAGTKPPSRAPFLKIEAEKKKALVKAKEKYEKTIKAADENVDWTRPTLAADLARKAAMAKHDEAKSELDRDYALIQQDYLESIAIQTADEDDRLAAARAKAAVPGARKPSRWHSAGVE